MRIKPLKPETLTPEIRYVHDEIANLIGHSQGQVKMIDEEGALLGPFTPMLHYPQFGVAALSFLRTLDNHATLNKAIREVAILTVGGAYGARFILYAHEIMAASFGIAPGSIATLAAGGRPSCMNEQEAIAHDVAYALVKGRVIPDSTYKHAVNVLGKDGIAELIFLISGYCLIAMIVNGFDISAPEGQE
jgi:4-carboxymuconolactone decarboxylase